MILKQRSSSARGSRRENPNKVACPHRLRFAYSGDDDLALEATHLAALCAGEHLSDWAGPEGKRFDGARGRSEFVALLA